MNSITQNYGDSTVAPVATFTNVEGQFKVSIKTNTISMSFNSGTWNGGAFNGPVYTDLTQSNIKGVRLDPTSNMAGLTSNNISFTSNSVTINWQGLSFDNSTIVVLDLLFAPQLVGLAHTANQMAVGAPLTRLFANNDSAAASPLSGAFVQAPPAAASAALNNISGEGLSGAQNAAFVSSSLFTSSIMDQTTFYGSGSGGAANSVTITEGLPGFMAYAPSDGTRAPQVIEPIHELADMPALARQMPASTPRTWHAWATGFGGADDIDGKAGVGSAAQSSTIYGGTLGVDYRFSENYLAGIAFGGSDAEFSVPDRSTSGSVTGAHIAFYDLFTLGAFYAASTTSASFFSNTTSRFVAGFGGLASETEKGDFDSREFRNRLEFGRHFATSYGLVTPFVALEIAELRSYGFQEIPLGGAGNFALGVQGQTTASVPSFLGLRLQREIALGNGLTLLPTLQAAWVHEFSPQRNVVGGLVSLPGAAFITQGASPASNAAQVKAGGELKISANYALFANFDGTFSGVDRLYAGKGGFRYVW